MDLLEANNLKPGNSRKVLPGFSITEQHKKTPPIQHRIGGVFYLHLKNMLKKELPAEFKAYLDKIRVGKHNNNIDRQYPSCDLNQAPLLRSIFEKNKYKKSDRIDGDLTDVPLEEIPLDRRPFEYLEVKTGKILGVDEAKEIVAKGTIFAILKIGSIELAAKRILRAAGIIYVENMSIEEIDEWCKNQTTWQKTQAKWFDR